MKTKLSAVYERIQNLFIKGLFTILPLILTIIVVNFIYRFLSNWLIIIHRNEPAIFHKIPGSEFLIAAALLIIIGIASKFLIINPIIHYFERIIHKIPLVNSIYSSAKKLVDFFNVPSEKEVKRQVVLVPFPQSKYFNIGFVLGNTSSSLNKQINNKIGAEEEYVRVFMPTSPSPATGFFFMVPKSILIYTDISFEEAIKAIVSCGLIQPEVVDIYKNEQTNTNKDSN